MFATIHRSIGFPIQVRTAVLTTSRLVLVHDHKNMIASLQLFRSLFIWLVVSFPLLLSGNECHFLHETRDMPFLILQTTSPRQKIRTTEGQHFLRRSPSIQMQDGTSAEKRAQKARNEYDRGNDGWRGRLSPTSLFYAQSLALALSTNARGLVRGSAPIRHALAIRSATH